MTALLWFTIRQHLRPRKLWFVLVLLISPCALALLVRHFDIAEDLEDMWRLYHLPMLWMYFMVVLPLVCMLHGSALIGSEVDGRTLVYLTTRRMRREVVLLVRLVAVWLLLTALAEVAAVVFYICTFAGLSLDRFNEAAAMAEEPAWVPWQDLLCYMRVIPFATAAFLSVCTLISLLFRRPLIISLIYLVFVEMVVANTPVRAQIYTINHQLRRMVKVAIPNLLDAFGSHREQEIIEAFYPPGATGMIPLAVVILVALVLGCVLMRTHELVPMKTGRE